VAVEERPAHGAAADIAPARQRTATLLAGAVALLAVAFAVAVVGGYREGWTWTGFADNGTLWAWLDLLVLPVALALLPLWYTTHEAFRESWRVAAALAVVAAVILLVGGYGLDWAFTGFRGKTLWDWMSLLVLPVTLLLLPTTLTAPERHRRALRAALVAGCVAFGVLVLCGYALDWAWTGFRGNTLWDWLHLMLVPFVLPAGLIFVRTRERGA
jgi:ABC-type glycerol-3-phosphate transport system permease component